MVADRTGHLYCRVQIPGSGSTLFALFDTDVQAKLSAGHLNAEMGEVRALGVQVML
ncbi:MAG TPA: hypothetical protein VHM90_09710 [Phycisphaerae bacterium]|nr:hypothetical protein [Phycisphaerae bacterium]